jgi:chemotaxis signal transduction protein
VLVDDRRVSESVVVRIGAGRYAVGLAGVAEVVTAPRTTRVPGLPRWLTGVANWRGRVLPVLDLRPLLGAEPSPLPSSARLVILSADQVEAGLIVDSVLGLLGPVEGSPQPVPATATADVAALVLGVVDDGQGPVSLLGEREVLALRSRLTPDLRTG